MAYQVQSALTGSGLGGSGRNYTAELWDGFDPAAFDRNPAMGHYFQDDFLSPPLWTASATTTGATGFYNAFADNTGTSTIGPAAIQGGGCKLFNTTTSQQTSLQYGPIGGQPFVFASAPKVTSFYHHVARVRFETRFQIGSVTASAQSIFVGFAGVLAALDLDNTTGDVVTSKSFFGWNIFSSTGPTLLRLLYQAAADTAPTALIANAGTQAASTWCNVGLDLNPMAPADQRCSFWFNSVKSSTYLTHAQLTATSTPTFPQSTASTAVFLSPTWMVKSIDGSDATLIVSNWRICNELLVAQGNEACA